MKRKRNSQGRWGPRTEAHEVPSEEVPLERSPGCLCDSERGASKDEHPMSAGLGELELKRSPQSFRRETSGSAQGAGLRGQHGCPSTLGKPSHWPPRGSAGTSQVSPGCT